MNTPKESREQATFSGSQDSDARDAAPISPEALKTLALSLSNLVANRSRNPHVSSAARFISTTLGRP